MAALPVYPAGFRPELGHVAHAQEVVRLTGLGCAELAGAFESLGNDCELGLVQRWCGAEPLGLFRFSNPEHGVVLYDVATGFADFGEGIAVELDRQPRREWIVIDRERQLREHSFIHEGEIGEAELLAKVRTRNGFLRRLMVERMREASHVFVIKSGEGRLDRGIVADIAHALRRHGSNWLLWVEPGVQVGKVVVLREGLMWGTIDRLTVQGDGTEPSWPGWLAVLAQARRCALKA